MKIKVDAECIRNGVRTCPHRGPIALAIKKAVGARAVEVRCDYVDCDWYLQKRSYAKIDGFYYDLSPVVFEWQRWYDQNFPPDQYTEIEFELGWGSKLV